MAQQGTHDPDDWRAKIEEEEQAQRLHLHRTRRFARLFQSGEPPQRVVDQLEDRPPSLSTVLLDNSTVSEALAFAYCESSSFRRGGLSDNRETVARALGSVIEALVLHETVLVGPFREVGSSAKGDVDLVHSDERMTDETLFWLTSLARRHALAGVREDPRLFDALCRSTDSALDRSQVIETLLSITVYGSDTSIHKIMESIEHDDFYLGDMSSRLFNMVSFATYGRSGADVRREADDAINIEMRNYRHIPREHLQEFFAAYLLYRTSLYLLIADWLGCTYRGDALRAPIVGCLVASPPYSGLASTIVGHAEDKAQELDDAANSFIGVRRFAVSFPSIANAVMAEATSRRECLSIAQQLRGSRAARRFRSFCAEVDEAILQGDRKSIERAIADLQMYGVKVTDELPTAAAAVDEGLKELVAYGSPVAASLLTVMTTPVKAVRARLKTQKFAMLDVIRDAPRIDIVRAKVDDLWHTLPPPDDAPRARDFQRRFESGA